MVDQARDNEAVWLAQLAEMPLRVVLDYLRERGWEPHAAGRWDVDRLPVVLPPLADADVPFDAEDTRS
jgi:hypothetical protein